MYKRQVTAKQEHVLTLSLFSEWHHICQCFDERFGHFCHHCRFICKTFMLWSLFLRNIYDVTYVGCMLFFKKAFPLPLGTVATRIAKENAKPFCCHNCTLLLLASFSQIWTILQIRLYLNAYELEKSQYCIVEPGFFQCVNEE